jgi:hypothetical protein
MYEPELSKATPEVLAQLLDLFRGSSSDTTPGRPLGDFKLSQHLLKNVRQFGYVPTPRQLFALRKRLSISTGGVFKLFGYRLDSMRRVEELLNGHRTRLVESYAFNRDRAVDLPGWLGGPSVFQRTAFLSEVVVGWQQGIPIRALRGRHWQREGIFYVQLGVNERAAMPGVPPGSFLAVALVDEAEQRNPNPKTYYFLQSGHGYLCARCVVHHGRLSLITHAHEYFGQQEFFYPGEIRIVGKAVSFGVRLPLAESVDDLPDRAHRPAPLILPWEQKSLPGLLAAERMRFGITEAHLKRANEILEDRLGTGISARTIRRYEHGAGKIPQTSTLLGLALVHSLRISDVLRVLDLWSDESMSYSLAMLMNARTKADLPNSFQAARVPEPISSWQPLFDEWGEWPTLLSMAIPDLGSWGHRILRINQSDYFRGLDPLLVPHSVAVLDEKDKLPPRQIEKRQYDWDTPVYALRHDAKTYCGYVEGDGTYLVMPAHPAAGSVPRLVFRRTQTQILGRLVGVASPLQAA